MYYIVTQDFYVFFQVGIILTDGQSQNLGKTLYEAFRAKMQKIFLFAIGIGANTNERELRGIASDAEDFMFKVDGYSALDAIKNVLAIRTCRGKICVVLIW